MGLFDPPAAKIRKCVPYEVIPQYDAFVERAETLTPADLDKKQRKSFVGFMAAAWVASENRAGRLMLGAHSGISVQDTLNKCHEQLGARGQEALELIEKLREDGTIKI